MEARLKEVQEIAVGLINEYVPHYSFKFSNGIRTLGQCNFRTRTITLSKHYVIANSDELVLDTILHEIAHALVGVGHGHNHVWKAKCREIGAKPNRCKDSVNVEVEHKYIKRCSNGCWESKMYRKPRNLHRYRCGKCRATLEVRVA